MDWNLIIEYFSSLEVHHITAIITAVFAIMSNVIWMIFLIKKLKNYKKVESGQSSARTTEKNLVTATEQKKVAKSIRIHKILFLKFLLFLANIANLIVFFVPSKKVSFDPIIKNLQKKINILENN